MHIKILAFGIAREICGARQFEMEVPAQTDTGQLKQLLQQQFPGLHQLASCLLAVNETYAHEDIPLQPGDEIAILPPVSGG